MKAVVLAAGANRRMWPLAQKKNKCMYEFLGKPLLWYALSGLKKAGISSAVIVISPEDELIKEFFGDGKKLGMSIGYTVQKEPKGMGDAVLTAKDSINETFFVLNATQANCHEIIAPMAERFSSKRFSGVLAARKTDEPQNYGMLKIDGERVVQIIEKPANGKEPSALRVVGVYLLPQQFFSILEKIPKHEYDFEDALQKLMEKEAVGFVAVDEAEEISLKYPWHMLSINKYMMNGLKRNVSSSAQIAKSAIVEGEVVIEDNVRVFENAVIKGPCYMSEGAVIGNNSLIRDHSYIGRNVQIGHNSEIKNSLLFDGSHFDNNVMLDSVIDVNCRFGSGTITANRRLDRTNVKSMVNGEKKDTGLDFLGAIVGEGVKTGILAGFMPGVKVGSGSLIGPGTMVMSDVAENKKLFIKAECVEK